MCRFFLNSDPVNPHVALIIPEYLEINAAVLISETDSRIIIEPVSGGNGQIGYGIFKISVERLYEEMCIRDRSCPVTNVK